MQLVEATEENENIIKNAHDTNLTGHQFFFKTLIKIQEQTIWKNIKTDVEKYIENCPICAIKKHERSRKKKKKNCINFYNRQKCRSKNPHGISSLGYRNHKTQRLECVTT